MNIRFGNGRIHPVVTYIGESIIVIVTGLSAHFYTKSKGYKLSSMKSIIAASPDVMADTLKFVDQYFSGPRDEQGQSQLKSRFEILDSYYSNYRELINLNLDQKINGD